MRNLPPVATSLRVYGCFVWKTWHLLGVWWTKPWTTSTGEGLLPEGASLGCIMSLCLWDLLPVLCFGITPACLVVGRYCSRQVAIKIQSQAMCTYFPTSFPCRCCPLPPTICQYIDLTGWIPFDAIVVATPGRTHNSPNSSAWKPNLQLVD